MNILAVVNAVGRPLVDPLHAKGSSKSVGVDDLVVGRPDDFVVSFVGGR